LPKAPHRVAATRHCLFRIENLLENASGRMAASARFRMSRWLGNEWPLVPSVFFATDDRQEEYQVTVDLARRPASLSPPPQMTDPCDRVRFGWLVVLVAVDGRSRGHVDYRRGEQPGPFRTQPFIHAGSRRRTGEREQWEPRARAVR
jgi:hypothetical protein